MFFYPTAYYFTIYDSICAGGSYLWEGQQIDAEGTYEEAYVSVMGADSIRILCFSLFICTGVDENLPSPEFMVYPVPVKEVLQVQCHVDNPEIVVVDLNGREVLTARGTSVDLSSLESGIYLVRLWIPTPGT